jgi:regulator of sirC expression with transglutaminase-like and TPR domain
LIEDVAFSESPRFTQPSLEDRWVRRPPFADSPEFKRLVSGEHPVRLSRIALEIARDAYPDLDIESYLERIQALADRVPPRCPARARVRDVLGQINWVLYVEEEMRGNTDDYYDARNSFLNEVLDRRLGIPISLSVLYRSVAEHLGVSMAGVNLPAHFMLRVDEGKETWFVDPFHAGAVMTQEQCEQKLSEILHKPVVLTDSLAAPCSIKMIVSRMLKNLKSIYLQAQDLPSALPVQRRLTALNPLDPGELRDLGVICVQADRPGEALDPLEAYLATSPPADQRDEIRGILEAARRRLAEWN